MRYNFAKLDAIIIITKEKEKECLVHVLFTSDKGLHKNQPRNYQLILSLDPAYDLNDKYRNLKNDLEAAN